MEESRDALEEGPVLLAFSKRDVLGLGTGGGAGGGAWGALGFGIGLV